MKLDHAVPAYNHFKELHTEIERMYNFSDIMMAPQWKLNDELEKFREVTYNKWWKPLGPDALRHMTASDECLQANGYKTVSLETLGKRLKKMTVNGEDPTTSKKKNASARKSMQTEKLPAKSKPQEFSLAACEAYQKNRASARMDEETSNQKSADSMEDELVPLDSKNNAKLTSYFKKADGSSTKKTAANDSLNESNLSSQSLPHPRTDLEPGFSQILNN